MQLNGLSGNVRNTNWLFLHCNSAMAGANASIALQKAIPYGESSLVPAHENQRLTKELRTVPDLDPIFAATVRCSATRSADGSLQRRPSCLSHLLRNPLQPTDSIEKSGVQPHNRTPMSGSIFADVPAAPRDPILGLIEAFNHDTRPQRVNLGVGVYFTDDGRIPVLRAVAEAERRRAPNRRPAATSRSRAFPPTTLPCSACCWARTRR